MEDIMYRSWRSGFKISKMKEVYPNISHLTDEEISREFGLMVGRVLFNKEKTNEHNVCNM